MTTPGEQGETGVCSVFFAFGDNFHIWRSDNLSGMVATKIRNEVPCNTFLKYLKGKAIALHKKHVQTLRNACK
jgi:hypothetical protein